MGFKIEHAKVDIFVIVINIKLLCTNVCNNYCTLARVVRTQAFHCMNI